MGRQLISARRDLVGCPPVSVIRLEVPGSLEYRDLAIRVVAAACKLVGAGAPADEARADFDNQVISAFGEAFNNAAIHAYAGRPLGSVEIEIDVAHNELTLRIADYGQSFDPTQVAEPDLDDLPESGMGLFIMRSFMDSVAYQAGAPNVLSMTKHLATRGGTP
jgi:serine/threonine-protein kinase RsbW